MSPAAGFFCGVRVMSKSAASLFRTVNIFCQAIIGTGTENGDWDGNGMGNENGNGTPVTRDDSINSWATQHHQPPPITFNHE